MVQVISKRVIVPPRNHAFGLSASSLPLPLFMLFATTLVYRTWAEESHDVCGLVACVFECRFGLATSRLISAPMLLSCYLSVSDNIAPDLKLSFLNNYARKWQRSAFSAPTKVMTLGFGGAIFIVEPREQIPNMPVAACLVGRENYPDTVRPFPKSSWIGRTWDRPESAVPEQNLEKRPPRRLLDLPRPCTLSSSPSPRWATATSRRRRTSASSSSQAGARGSRTPPHFPQLFMLH